MSESGFGEILGLISMIATISISIFSGILAWNWIEPDNFFGAILFLIVWGILSKVGHMIVMGLILVLSGEG